MLGLLVAKVASNSTKAQVLPALRSYMAIWRLHLSGTMGINAKQGISQPHAGNRIRHRQRACSLFVFPNPNAMECGRFNCPALREDL